MLSTHLHPAWAAFSLSSFDTNSTESVSPTIRMSSATGVSPESVPLVFAPFFI